MLMLVSSSSVQSGTSVVQASRSASSVMISPERIDFSPQTVQTASHPTAATLTNGSSGNVSVRDISASGIDFTETNDCPATLVPGASCRIVVTFTPAITGLAPGNNHCERLRTRQPALPHFERNGHVDHRRSFLLVLERRFLFGQQLLIVLQAVIESIHGVSEKELIRFCFLRAGVGGTL